MRFFTLICWLMLMTAHLAAAAEAAKEAAKEAAAPLLVVTGNTIVQDITATIGGPRIQATCLLQPGVDPHAYQPVPDDVKRLAAARLVIINGLGFEGWFEGLAKEAGFNSTVVVATRGITPLTMSAHDHDHDHDHDHGAVDDPHAFNSIPNGVRYAENIRDALIAADAAGADHYRQAAAAYIAELRQADAAARKGFASLPKAQRKLVTNHDALQYFAKEYGFAILAPNTALDDSQPSAKELAELIDFIKREGVKGVFLEFGKNDKIIAQIGSEAGVTISERLYLDGVGPATSTAHTYLGMFQTNVATIMKCLQGRP
jgi:zinc/manganese transport system substrate-binding protein